MNEKSNALLFAYRFTMHSIIGISPKNLLMNKLVNYKLYFKRY